ncbi:MAG: pseudouridine synthase [Actinomycetota bacterium]|nr:pseudouridine synthase [Actinomycetota bacterium]
MTKKVEQARLQKVLAEAGLGSRRKCEELIASGRVKVNGAVVSELGSRVDPLKDEVEVDGVRIGSPPKVYFAMNKPRGYLTTMSDPFGRPTVKDLLSGDFRLFPVGRLDQDSEGLLILTNDGELANRLMHPSFKVLKIYEVEVLGFPSETDLNSLREGIELDGRLTALATVEELAVTEEGALYRVGLREGRKRQLRRMFDSIGHGVISLKRTDYGPLSLRAIKPKGVRPLSELEVDALKRAVKLSE